MGMTRRHLSRHPYLASLDGVSLDALAARASLLRLSRGELIALEGDECRAVYLIVEGRIRATKMSLEGREQVINDMGPGQVFYIVAAIDGQPLPVTTRASTRATLISIPVDDFGDLLANHAAVSRAVLVDFAQRLRHLSSLVEDLSLKSVAARLAKLLLSNVDGGQQRRMTQREMATQLGTVREVVARHLQRFVQQGWIQVQRGRIIILDAEALRGVAES